MDYRTAIAPDPKRLLIEAIKDLQAHPAMDPGVSGHLDTVMPEWRQVTDMDALIPAFEEAERRHVESYYIGDGS